MEELVDPSMLEVLGGYVEGATAAVSRDVKVDLLPVVNSLLFNALRFGNRFVAYSYSI